MHLLKCAPAASYTIGPRNRGATVNLNDQIFENFEYAQNRPESITYAPLAHTVK